MPPRNNNGKENANEQHHEHQAPDHRYLQRLSQKKYRSYSRAVVAAVNDYFSRQERLAADPYLETREKEDAFLQKVLETIREGLNASNVGLAGLAALLQGVQTSAAAPDQSAANEGLDTAMDFISSL